MNIKTKLRKPTKKTRTNYKEQEYYHERKLSKKNASTTTKEMSNEDREKNKKIFNLSSKTWSRYQTNIFLC